MTDVNGPNARVAAAVAAAGVEPQIKILEAEARTAAAAAAQLDVMLAQSPTAWCSTVTANRCL